MERPGDLPGRAKDRIGSGDCSLLENSRASAQALKNTPHRKRPPQVRCELCGKLSDKAKGRPRRFCSDACRAAAHRVRAGFKGSHAPLPTASRNGLTHRGGGSKINRGLTCGPVGLKKTP